MTVLTLIPTMARIGHTPYELEQAFARHDTSAPGHKDRVAAYAGRLAARAGLSGLRAMQIAQATRRHDVGKLTVPRAILNKPARPTEGEAAMLRAHAANGAEMLTAAGASRLEIEIARHHHERWDGGGYPDGLAGTAIPLESRIVAVADVFDALTADRPYKAGLSVAKTLEIMTGDMVDAFDPNLLETFIASLPAAPDRPVAA